LKLATTTWFSGPTDLQDALVLAKACGYEAVAIAATPSNLNSSTDEIARSLRKLSLRVSCLSAGVPFFRDPSNLNLHSRSAEVRSKTIDYVLRCVDYVSELDGEFVYVCSISKELGQTGSEASSLFKESLEKCVEYGEKSGIRIAVEPFPTGCLPSFRQTAELAKTLPGLGLVYDVGHEILFGALSPIAGSNVKLILDVHLNNNDGSGDKHWSPAKGKIQPVNFANLVSNLREISYQRFVTIELAEVDKEGTELGAAKKFIESLSENNQAA
jgi:sugar phosphate isomerase/epimerase